MAPSIQPKHQTIEGFGKVGGKALLEQQRKTIAATASRIKAQIGIHGSPRDIEAGRILGELLINDGIDLIKGVLVEFGAGNGNFTRVFLDVNSNFVALEMDGKSAPKDLIEKSVIKLGDGIEALAAMPDNSIETMVSIMFGPLIGKPYNDKAFDIERFLSELNRVLTPAGQFIVISDLNTVSILEGEAYSHHEELLKACRGGAKTTPLTGFILRKRSTSALGILIREVLHARAMTYRLIVELANPDLSQIRLQQKRLEQADEPTLRRLMAEEAREKGCRPEFTLAYVHLCQRREWDKYMKLILDNKLLQIIKPNLKPNRHTNPPIKTRLIK